MKFTKKTQKERIEINSIVGKCWSIYNEHGGYEYNDEMIYQLDGIRYSMEECECDEDIEHMLNEAKEVLKYFVWVKNIKELIENEPPQIYC